MCESTFIPLEQISDLLAADTNIELTSEKYISLRKEIEDAKLVPRLKRGNSFKQRLINFASQQINYLDDDVKTKLERRYVLPIKKNPSIPRPLGQKEQMQKIENYLAGYYATWIIDIGLKSGLFLAIAQANTAMSADDLSRQLGLNVLYVQVWCRAAYGFELLDIEPSKGYRLVPHLEEVLLDSTNPNNMRFDIEFGTVLHQDFAVFPTYLRTGKIWPLVDHPDVIQRLYVEATLDDYPVLIEVMLPHMVAPEFLERLKQKERPADEPPSILDVGTGAGFALVYYAEQFPSADIIGLDINPDHIEQAKHNIAQAANLPNNHIQIYVQDVTKLEDKSKYDLIIINLALHEIALSDYPHLFELLYDALRPGGVLLISDYHFPDLAAVPTYRYPGYQLLLSLLLHLALVGNTLVPSQTVTKLLGKANFKYVQEKHHPMEERKVIVAKKP